YLLSSAGELIPKFDYYLIDV
ncbi:unnamed protein product, partial [Cuscuta campestris]